MTYDDAWRGDLMRRELKRRSGRTPRPAVVGFSRPPGRPDLLDYVAAALLALCLVTALSMACSGCGPADSGHRSGARWNLDMVSGIKIWTPGDWEPQERRDAIEAISFHFAEWIRRRQRLPPAGLGQIRVYDRKRGPGGVIEGAAAAQPRRQNHWANGISAWGTEDGVIDVRSGTIHVYRGRKFELPVLYHLLHHWSFFGPVPGRATDFGHVDSSWAGVNAEGITVAGVIAAQR